MVEKKGLNLHGHTIMIFVRKLYIFFQIEYCLYRDVERANKKKFFFLSLTVFFFTFIHYG